MKKVQKSPKTELFEIFWKLKIIIELIKNKKIDLHKVIYILLDLKWAN